MKHILLLLGLLATGTAAANKVDSLRAAAADPHLSDTLRFQAFRKMIWAGYLFSDPDSARILADSMYRMAMRKSMLSEMGDAYSIRGISFMITGGFKSALLELQEAERLFTKAGDVDGIGAVQNNMGNAYWKIGDLSRAIELYTKSLQTSEKKGQTANMAKGELNIGLIYSDLRDTLRAQAHWERSLALSEEVHDEEGIAQASYNLSNALWQRGDTAASVNALQRAIQGFRATGNINYYGAALSNLAGKYVRAHRFTDAHAMVDSSMNVLRPLGEEFLLRSRIILTDLYLQEERLEEAIRTGEAIRTMTDTAATLKDRKDLYRLLADAYYSKGQMGKAYERLQTYQLLQDSLVNDENNSGLLRQEYRYAGEKRALADSLTYSADKALQVREIQKQKMMRNGFMGGFALVALFAGVFFTQRNRISKARKRSDELLLNILPEEVAEELKAKGEADAVQIDQVTVLFTDFKGFTQMSEQLTAKELVADIHECFSAFDHIMTKHGIEKIKTIGDAYMAAGGLPTPNTTHALDVVSAALEIRDFIAEGKALKIAKGLPYFEIRIGIHTGPVVAGIVGVKKFQYDIWGDTVNTASRMESSGEVGQVNISEATYALVKDAVSDALFVARSPATDDQRASNNGQRTTTKAFTFTPRGKVQAKGKGEMAMYFVRTA